MITVRDDAIAEQQALAEHLRAATGLELSPEKTKITTLTDGFEFLGCYVRRRWDQRFGYFPSIEIPKAKSADIRYKIKQLTGRNTTCRSLGQTLQNPNPVLRGWANYYRHCRGAKKVFTSIDWYVTDRLQRWMRRKHPTARVRDLVIQTVREKFSCRACETITQPLAPFHVTPRGFAGPQLLDDGSVREVRSAPIVEPPERALPTRGRRSEPVDTGRSSRRLYDGAAAA
jgi:hypothetical protein